MSDIEFLQKYEELLDKDYCNCNEMNCIDNNSPRRILNIAKELHKENQKLKKQQKEFIAYLKNEKDRLAREVSFIYEDGLGTARLVNGDIFEEVNEILLKYKEIIGEKK